MVSNSKILQVFDKEKLSILFLLNLAFVILVLKNFSYLSLSIVIFNSFLNVIVFLLVKKSNDIPYDSSVSNTIQEEKDYSNTKVFDSEMNSLVGLSFVTAENLKIIYSNQFETVSEIEYQQKNINTGIYSLDTQVQDVSSALNNLKDAMDSGMLAIENVKSISSTIDEFSTIITSLSDEYHLLSAKIKSIEQILFMAKLLTFNASVEASRLGDAGRGVSVIAGEMNKLSYQIASLNSEIKDALEFSNKRMQNVGASIKSNFESSKKNIEVTAESIEKLITGIENISSKMSESAETSNTFRKIFSEMNALLEKVNKTAAMLGVSAANVKTIEINLSEIDK